MSPNAGEVRLVNATGDTLDFYADADDDLDLLSEDVASFSAGRYEDLNKGDYTFSVRGGTAGATLATLDGVVPKSTHQAIVAYSTAGTTTLAIIDEEEDDPDKGSVKLRFFNTAAADAGNVDVYLVDMDVQCLALAEAPVATGVSGLQSAFTTINPRSAPGYRMCVTAANDKTDLRLDTTLVVDDRQVVTVILSRTSGVLLNGLVLVQQGDLTPALNASARVRLAVGVAAGNTVTAQVGSVQLAAGAIPRTVTGYTVVPSGPVTAEIALNGGTTVGTELTLAGGADYTLLVAGTSSVPTLIADDNSLSTNTAKPIKLRLLNGTNGATNGSLGPTTLVMNSGLLVSGIEFTKASNYVFVESSTGVAVPFEVRTANNTVLCTSSSTLSATPSVFTIFTLGDPPTDTAPACLLQPDR